MQQSKHEYYGLCYNLHDPIEDFCRRFGHQTAVVDRKLYIDGGLVNWKPLESDHENYTNSWLVWHDLDTNSKDNMPQLHANLSKNASIPSVHGGALWADDVNYRLFLFGGEFYDGIPETSSLMSYDIWYDRWDDFGPPSAGISRVSYGASTTVKERGEGYYYGGYRSNHSVPGWTGPPRAAPDLIRYKMDTNSWTKLAGPDDIKRAEGVMTFIPASDRGMLVYFGGLQDPGDNGTMVPQPMDRIFLYDIISNKWHIQEANGTIPDYRRRFCAGAVWAKDRSSYNIYLNAGIGLDGYGFDDVYILSLPSFEWIKTYPLDRNGTGEFPSHSLSCDVVNEGSQILAIGGTFPADDDQCDSDEVWGVHNIDLGDQIKSSFKHVWAGYEPALFGYKVPSFVTSVIGGTKDGGATKMEPESGFVNHDLGTLLGMKAAFSTRARWKDGRSDPATATASQSSSSKPGLSTGAIIGIAVGGAVVLLTALVGLWLLRRKRKAKSNVQLVPTAEPVFPTAYTPPSFSPSFYNQSPDSGQRRSPWDRDEDWERSEQNRVWRPPFVNSQPSELDGQGYNFRRAHGQI
ncbi:unnamed protein product [Fusarium equiseti]|uniref:Kelch repeat-containing protein n=1 Tax=Fusarium equiseti TaxID=61235 RepID=A0A8J2NP14_FUSEQ|nr:unnamed protein product [Fusarium equiseti]